MVTISGPIVGFLENLPPSGSWSGYYLYGADGAKHGMRLHLTFTAVGAIVGSGNDDVAPFTISGVFDGDTNQAIELEEQAG